MQTQITSNDAEIEMKVDIVASLSYETNMSRMKRLIGDNFDGYTNSLDYRQKRILMEHAFSSGRISDLDVDTKTEVEGYDDAFQDLKGITDSVEPSISENLHELMVNYFSMVLDNNATKKLSRNLYKLADSLWGNSIIASSCNTETYEVTDIAERISRDDSSFFEDFEDMFLANICNKVTRGLAGTFGIRYKRNQSYYSGTREVYLPSSLEGLAYLQEYYKNDTDISFDYSRIKTEAKSLNSKRTCCIEY